MPAEIIDLPQLKNCHDVESEVRREILAIEGVTVSSLVVRRIPNGVCLQGVIRRTDGSIDVCDVIRRIPGVTEILDHTMRCADSD